MNHPGRIARNWRNFNKDRTRNSTETSIHLCCNVLDFLENLDIKSAGSQHDDAVGWTEIGDFVKRYVALTTKEISV